MKPISLDALRFDAGPQIAKFQRLMSLPRETLPQLTAEETRRALDGAARRLRLELVEIKHAAPIFLLLPWGDRPPRALVFLSWHAEALPVAPAAMEGAERLALAATLAALEAVAADGAFGSPGTPEVAIVVSPGATHGSLVLDRALRHHRPRLQAPVAHWVRIGAGAPRRRRVFLGARGRVVLGVWDQGANPYSIRDQVVAELSEEAYGPRPLDFELLRKLSSSAEAAALLEGAALEPGSPQLGREERFRRVLFEPRGDVLAPSVPHPGRPQAWITIETAEAMEPDDILRRVRARAGEARVEMAEAFIWDRLNIHHPTVQALIATAKSRSDGAEIWPMAPWPTPSGIFSRALGVGLGEWAIALPEGLDATAIRFPSPEIFEGVAREAAELILHALAESAPAPGPSA